MNPKSYKKLVMPEDLNPAETLFGGKLLQWLDEVGVIYIYETFREKKIVTTELKNVYFKCSPKSGDIVEFIVSTEEERKASVWLNVIAKNITHENNPVVINCKIRFAFSDKLKRNELR
jgi:acyl-CoA hydrolase